MTEWACWGWYNWEDLKDTGKDIKDTGNVYRQRLGMHVISYQAGE